jgi:hypothetical protein
MNTSVIETLLEKFYEGDTSLQEEKELREFFMQPDVPAHLMHHKQLFDFFEGEGRQEITGRDFDRKLSARLSVEPAETKIVPIYSARQRFMYFTGIAASFLILAGLLFIFQRDVFKHAALNRVSLNTEIAYSDASNALLMVSGNLNHGLEQVERLQMVDKAMTNMELFNKFYQYQTIIINPDEVSNRSKKSK